MSSGYSSGENGDESTSSGEESASSDGSSRGSWDSDSETDEEAMTVNKKGEEVHTLGPGMEVPDHLLPRWQRKNSPPKQASDEDEKLKEKLRITFDRVCMW